MVLVMSSSRAGLDAHGAVYFHAIDTTMCAALARQAARTALEAAWVGGCGLGWSLREPVNEEAGLGDVAEGGCEGGVVACGEAPGG